MSQIIYKYILLYIYIYIYISVIIKLKCSFRRHQNETATGQSLPALNGPTFLSRSQSQENKKSNEESSLTMTEKRVNLEQIHHFRLQKSPSSHKSVASLPVSKNNVTNSPIQESRFEEIDFRENQIDSYISLGKSKKLYELPKTLNEGFYYSSSNKRNEVDSKSFGNESFDLTNGSRQIHARFDNFKVHSSININFIILRMIFFFFFFFFFITD
jgi:hypothetical protein